MEKLTPQFMMSDLTYEEKIRYWQKKVDKNTEYIDENGMIRCKFCHDTKLYISPDKQMVQHCICKCQGEKYEREQKEKYAQHMRELAKKKRLKSLLVGTYEQATFENTDLINVDQSFIMAYQSLQKYSSIANEVLLKGYGIYIHGKCGVGKTHLIACLANSLLDQGYNVLFANMIDISNAINETYHTKNKTSDILNQITTVDFLFIDDIGTEKYIDKNGEENWRQEQIYSILNTRLINSLPTIFTSNFSIGQLIKVKGLNPKIAERIYELSTKKIELMGEGYRHKKLANIDCPF